ncbi:MAG: nucleoside recognition domain-containing protein [bacterium]
MVSLVWFFLIFLGIVYAIFSGQIDTINNSILSNGNTAIELILSIMPIIVLWTGIMKIAEDSGLLTVISRFFEPVLKFLFPNIPKDNPALGYIASNVTANMMGLGSAATPFGLKAMKELQKINNDKTVASSSMITFLVLNTGGVTLIPTTVIALRVASGSNDPTSIVLPAILATLISNFCGLSLDYLIRRRNNE